ncbi:hypothetical protein OG930_25820 [Streptomyces sp. NBC_01799]|uniref:hypothetical protein n=1 Tax=Streptomyces sp. NBC_01800 TaxID=2975945 RepID=UPI002DD8042E|nr:hypothetical protein [Streptomyces sp. NBC_01800]WSA70249.1 hypothetical protein OIE65_26600 [Streptomyces sp. NBC_01800]WSA78726.1 hypothetical protein OG930_25820 [Streptomyces sp. NBC_01799]
MSHRSERNSAVFVDASGRRGRFMKYAAALLGVVCVLFLGTVVVGLSGSGPVGGSLPWGGNGADKPPARAEHSPAPVDAPRPKASVAKAEASKATGTASASPGPTTRSAGTATSSTAVATSTPASTAGATSAPAPGNAGDNPGRGTPAAPAATGKGKNH